jgi:hypothetical protein
MLSEEETVALLSGLEKGEILAKALKRLILEREKPAKPAKPAKKAKRKRKVAKSGSRARQLYAFMREVGRAVGPAEVKAALNISIGNTYNLLSDEVAKADSPLRRESAGVYVLEEAA